MESFLSHVPIISFPKLLNGGIIYLYIFLFIYLFMVRMTGCLVTNELERMLKEPGVV
jgi:hypothetical protein